MERRNCAVNGYLNWTVAIDFVLAVGPRYASKCFLFYSISFVNPRFEMHVQQKGHCIKSRFFIDVPVYLRSVRMLYYMLLNRLLHQMNSPMVDNRD